jgi:dTDP-4-dehydrorhamnose reductase
MALKRILITGVCGLLGQNLLKVFGAKADVIGVDLLPRPSFLNGLSDYRVLDISDEDAVREVLSALRPDVVINTAAITNVDACEKEQEKADHINHQAVKGLLKACGKNTRFIQISTDYVFDGKNGPYSDEAKPHPVSFYGQTKYWAELAVCEHSEKNLIVRTMVIFGNGVGLKPDFITWVKSSLSAGKEISVVTDQIGNITLAGNLADNLQVLLEQEVQGVVSISGADRLSRFDIAVQAAEFFGLNAGLVRPIKTADLKQAAPRPLSSGFVHNRARLIPGIRLLTFKEQLEEYRHG